MSIKSRTKLLLAGLACAWLAAACGDNHQAPPPPPPEDAGVDSPVTEELAPCLERPTDLPRPPGGALPCELLPPGFTPAR
jgi:hypothetical protein